MNQICQNEDKMPMFLLELPCQTQFYCFRHNIKSNTKSCIENTKTIDATKVINERQN